MPEGEAACKTASIPCGLCRLFILSGELDCRSGLTGRQSCFPAFPGLTAWVARNGLSGRRQRLNLIFKKSSKKRNFKTCAQGSPNRHSRNYFLANWKDDFSSLFVNSYFSSNDDRVPKIQKDRDQSICPSKLLTIKTFCLTFYFQFIFIMSGNNSTHSSVGGQ